VLRCQTIVYLVTSYALPSTATQQSSLLLCVLNSSQVQDPRLAPPDCRALDFMLKQSTRNEEGGGGGDVQGGSDKINLHHQDSQRTTTCLRERKRIATLHTLLLDF
jgi:hypothetical protein